MRYLTDGLKFVGWLVLGALTIAVHVVGQLIMMAANVAVILLTIHVVFQFFPPKLIKKFLSLFF